jgi:SAM-dependent methyltransferase
MSARYSAPSALRNRDYIRDILKQHFPTQGKVLEIACGSGEHSIYMAKAFPATQWQPSDMDLKAIASTTAWVENAALTNIMPPIQLDVTKPDWAVGAINGCLCVNMIHISPWASTVGLMQGAGKHLTSGGILALYGPFIVKDKVTTTSNQNFDNSLKSRNLLWGIRHIDDVKDVAISAGLTFKATHDMPANNLMVIFEKTL